MNAHLNRPGRWSARHRVLAMGALLAMLLISGCAALSLPWTERQSEAPAPIALTAWLPSASVSAQTLLTAQMTEFIDANVGISVTVDLLDTSAPLLIDQIAGDAPPDLVEIELHRLPALVAAGALTPLPDGLLDQDAFFPFLINGVTVDGVPYCLPKEVHTLGLYYNAALFEAAAIPYPSAEWGWAELQDAAAAISALPTVKFTAFGLVLSTDPSRWLPFYLQAGGTWPSVELSQSAAEKALSFYAELRADGLAIEPSYYGSSWAGPIFGNERVGMVIEGNWLAAYLDVEFPDVRYGVAPLPSGPANAATLSFATCYAVPAASANPVRAFDLAAHLASPEAMGQRLESSVATPARRQAAIAWETSYPALRSLRTQLDVASIWQLPLPGQDLAEMVATLQPRIEAALANELSPEPTLDEATGDQ